MVEDCHIVAGSVVEDCHIVAGSVVEDCHIVADSVVEDCIGDHMFERHMAEGCHMVDG